MFGKFMSVQIVGICILFTVPFSTALSGGVDPAILQELVLPLQTALKGDCQTTMYTSRLAWVLTVPDKNTCKII